MKLTFRLAAASLCLVVCQIQPVYAGIFDHVTLFGIVDAGVSYVDNGPEGEDRFGITHGGLSGSRWGLRGNETLTDDLRVRFTLEGGVNTITGNTLQGGRLFGRQANVSLVSDTWGGITLGRQNTLMISWMNKYNPFGNANFSSGKRVDTAFSDRMDQAIRYDGKIGNWSVGGYYSVGWNNSQDWADEKKGRMFGAGVKYNPGALDVAVLYHSKHATNPAADASSDNREDRVIVGASYNMERVKLFAGYGWLEQELTERKQDRDMYWLGTTFRVSSTHRISLAAYHLNGTVCPDLNATTCIADVANEEQKPTLYVLGNEFDLAKSTTVYANLAFAANSNGSAISVVNADGRDVQRGDDQLGAIVGVRYRF